MNEYYRSQYNFKQDKPPKNKLEALLKLFKRQPKTKPIAPTEQVDHFLVNPYRRPQPPKKSKTKFYLVLLVVAITVWIGTLIYLPYFKINKITYLGLNFIKKEEIDAHLKNNLLNSKWLMTDDSYFLISTNRLEKELNKKYSLNSVVVKKIFPNELLVDLDEKISTIIYDNGLSYYLLDNDGGVLKFLDSAENPEINLTGIMSSSTLPLEVAREMSAPTSSATSTTPATTTPAEVKKDLTKTHTPEYRKIKKNFGSYPVLYDTRNIVVQENQPNIISKKIIEAIISWQNILEKEGMVVKYMATEHPLGGITVYTDRAWKMQFQPTGNLEKQLAMLRAVLKDNKINEYIDLRFEDRIYWK